MLSYMVFIIAIHKITAFLHESSCNDTNEDKHIEAIGMFIERKPCGTNIQIMQESEIYSHCLVNRLKLEIEGIERSCFNVQVVVFG